MLSKPVITMLLIGALAPVQARAVGNAETEGLVQQYLAASQQSPGLAKGLPIHLFTRQEKNRLTVKLIGVMPYSYTEVASVLSQPQSYCEFLPLMFNVKSCIVAEQNPQTQIRYYVAGKHYNPPLTSFRINSVYRLLQYKGDFLSVNLESDEDSLGSSQYRVELRAIPYNGQTLISVNSLYAPGRLTRMATYTYINVFARNKPGFTMVKQDDAAKPSPITGFPAIIERSSVRAYLALKSLLTNRHLRPEQQFEARLRTWYDLNSPYNKQLYELDRNQYLDIKRRERANQLRLQAKKGVQSAPVKVGLLGLSD